MEFFLALQFLTVIPSPLRRAFDPRALGRSQAYFPLVGLVVGALLAALDLLLQVVLPAPLVAGGLLAALVLLTGGLHLDGLIDTCDGLFLHRAPEARLAIMRDSRAGSFGVIGAATVLLLKYAGLLALGDPARTAVIVLMPVIGRWAMVLALSVFPYARQEGNGVPFQGQGRGPLLAATLTAVALAVVLWPERGPYVLVGVALWTLLVGRFITSRLGGLTGDSYGALNETAEVLVLIGAAAFWRGS